MTDVLALIDYAARLAIAGILLWYVVEALPMPAPMRRVTQGLIVLVLLLAVLARVTSDEPRRPIGSDLIPPNPATPQRPSIVR
jgi:hypothetical protein